MIKLIAHVPSFVGHIRAILVLSPATKVLVFTLDKLFHGVAIVVPILVSKPATESI